MIMDVLTNIPGGKVGGGLIINTLKLNGLGEYHKSKWVINKFIQGKAFGVGLNTIYCLQETHLVEKQVRVYLGGVAILWFPEQWDSVLGTDKEKQGPDKIRLYQLLMLLHPILLLMRLYILLLNWTT